MVQAPGSLRVKGPRAWLSSRCLSSRSPLYHQRGHIGRPKTKKRGAREFSITPRPGSSFPAASGCTGSFGVTSCRDARPCSSLVQPPPLRCRFFGTFAVQPFQILADALALCLCRSRCKAEQKVRSKGNNLSLEKASGPGIGRGHLREKGP